MSAFDYYQENIIDLNQRVTGFADLVFAARVQTLRRPIAVAFNLI